MSDNRRITIEVAPGNESKALGLVHDFLERPENHRAESGAARRHGIGYRLDVGGGNTATFYVWGNPRHVRVRESG